MITSKDLHGAEIKDSGSRTKFPTGAQRDCHEGKGRMDLLPVRALIEVAKVYEEGAKKYEARNWEKGIPLSRFMDSGLRHAMKWLKGDRDEPHLEQACWNFLCCLDTLKRIEDGVLPAELNDLPWRANRGIPEQAEIRNEIPQYSFHLNGPVGLDCEHHYK